MKVILIAVLLVGIVGGIYGTSSYIPEIQQVIQKIDSKTDDQVSNIQATHQQPVGLPPASNSQSSIIGSLAIVNSAMYYHAPSFVTVKNTGTDAVIVQSVSYGQLNTPIANVHLQPGAQQQIAIPQANGAPGSSYLLKVQGVSATSGKLIGAQATALLKDPVSRLEVVFSRIDFVGDGNPVLQVTVRNSGMDLVSVVSIECGKPVPSHLWALDGKVTLQPNEEKLFNIQLDSSEYIGANPQHGSTKQVTIRGENSLGDPVSVLAAAPVYVQVQQSVDAPVAETNELVGTKLPMGQAVIHVQASGHYVLSFEVVNTLSQDVKVDSLKVNGAEIPGWTGSTLIAFTSMKSTVTSSQGVTSADIGSSVEIIILGHLSQSSQGGGTASSVYAITSAQVYGP